MADIRKVLASADHPVAALNLSGSTIAVGYDQANEDPTVYLMLTDLDPDHKSFMTLCETLLLIAALEAALCSLDPKDRL